MGRSSPRVFSSARARSRRRWKTAGAREGSCPDCGLRIVDCGLGGGESAVRNRQSAIAAAPAATNLRRCIVLAPPESAAYITRPSRKLEGGFPMQFEARIEPLTGKLQKVTYRWDPDTDIHSVVVVTWPDDIRPRDTLPIPEPAKDGRVVFPGRKSQPRVAAVEVDTALTVEKNANESVLHIRVGRQRVATVVRVADLLLVEVDKNSRLAGLWFLEVPPFPNVEATA